jgi:hypothetical protein
MKVQHSLKEDRCWAFDLKGDPDEIKPLDCTSYPLQVKDLQEFVRDHDSRLILYNAWIRNHETGAVSQASKTK